MSDPRIGKPHYAKLKDGTLVWVGPSRAELQHWKDRALVAEAEVARLKQEKPNGQ